MGIGRILECQRRKRCASEAPGKIAFRFHSRDLHMVLAPAKNGKPGASKSSWMAPLRAKITELIPMPMGPARSGSRECINSFGKKVGQETDSLRSSSLIPASSLFVHVWLKLQARRLNVTP